MLSFLSDAYRRLAELVPKSRETILDLGCGTGLELDAVFEFFPDIRGTGSDIKQAMLDRLSQKHHRKNLYFIYGDFLTTAIGTRKQDAAMSFQVRHFAGWH